MPDFSGDWSSVLKNMEEAAVQYAVIVGYDLESSKRAVEIAGQNTRLLAAVGIHPHDASSMDASAKIGRAHV